MKIKDEFLSLLRRIFFKNKIEKRSQFFIEKTPTLEYCQEKSPGCRSNFLPNSKN
jgi:hypothetical protein